jgi:hypothetical protein
MRRPNKYHAKRTTVDGITFASAKESRRYEELKILQRGGLIADLKIQPRFDFMVNGIKVGRFTPDFQYTEKCGRVFIEDVKGGKATKTEAYRLRVRLFRALYPQYEVRET